MMMISGKPGRQNHMNIQPTCRWKWSQCNSYLWLHHDHHHHHHHIILLPGELTTAKELVWADGRQVAVYDGYAGLDTEQPEEWSVAIEWDDCSCKRPPPTFLETSGCSTDSCSTVGQPTPLEKVNCKSTIINFIILALHRNHNDIIKTLFCRFPLGNICFKQKTKSVHHLLACHYSQCFVHSAETWLACSGTTPVQYLSVKLCPLVLIFTKVWKWNMFWSMRIFYK